MSEANVGDAIVCQAIVSSDGSVVIKLIPNRSHGVPTELLRHRFQPGVFIITHYTRVPVRARYAFAHIFLILSDAEAQIITRVCRQKLNL